MVSIATVFAAVVSESRLRALKTREAIAENQSPQRKLNDTRPRCHARLSERWSCSTSRSGPPPRSSRAWLARFIPGIWSRFSKDVLTRVHLCELAVEGTEVAVHRSTR